MTRGTVRSSTRGGRSVLRSAAAVEAVTLRSLTLGASLPLASLTSLGNPLAHLLDEALDLSGIDQVLDRSADPASARRPSAGARSPAASRPAASRPAGGPGIGSAAAVAARGVGHGAGHGVGSAIPGGIGTAARSAATALQTAADVGTSVAAALALGIVGESSRAAGQRADGRSAPVHRRANDGGPARAVSSGNAPGRVPEIAPDLDPAQVRAGASTNALRRAARPDGASAAAAGSPSARNNGRTPDTRPAAAADTRQPATHAIDRAPGHSDRSAARGSSPIAAAAVSDAAYPAGVQASPPARREFTGGGLAELVARWQDGEPDTLEPPVDTAPVWAPLTSTGFDRERPLRLGDEDRIELALEQILRREVERHGLEGGR